MFFCFVLFFFFCLVFLSSQTFLGNYDRHSEVKNILSGGVLARWLRFVGKAEHNKFCMRVEIFGVKRNPGKQTCSSNEFTADTSAIRIKTMLLSIAVSY